MQRSRVLRVTSRSTFFSKLIGMASSLMWGVEPDAMMMIMMMMMVTIMMNDNDPHCVSIVFAY